MQHLEGHSGPWSGSNAFRLMPGDAPALAPISAAVVLAAGGAVAQVAYSWHHSADGPQDGLLMIGRGSGEGAAAAFWGDSWHQRPEPRHLDGVLDGGVVTVGYSYAGDWRWEIVVDATSPNRLVLTMNNVVPESAATAEMGAGPYAAMEAELTRA